jgi:hypothetical protein
LDKAEYLLCCLGIDTEGANLIITRQFWMVDENLRPAGIECVGVGLGWAV